MSKEEELRVSYLDQMPATLRPPEILKHVCSNSCPQCQGETLFVVRLWMKPDDFPPELVKGGVVTGLYVSCVACHYASGLDVMLAPFRRIDVN